MNINRDQAEGRAKEAAGALIGDDELKKEGKADQRAGDAKQVVRDVADKAEDLVDEIKKKVKGD
jgi:uncharacterized protein YjbJ (UPF0337 family)